MATIQSVHHEQFIRSLDFRKESDTLYEIKVFNFISVNVNFVVDNWMIVT